jgi:hypothetical protein
VGTDIIAIRQALDNGGQKVRLAGFRGKVGGETP